MKPFLSEQGRPDPPPPPYASLDYSLKKSKNPKIQNTLFLRNVKISFFSGGLRPANMILSCFPCGVAYDCRLSTIENVGSLIYNFMESYTLYHWITIALAKISAIVPVIYDPVFGNCIFQAYKLEF